MRSSFIGEMEAARFAGMMAINKEHSASKAVARLSATSDHSMTVSVPFCGLLSLNQLVGWREGFLWNYA